MPSRKRASNAVVASIATGVVVCILSVSIMWMIFGARSIYKDQGLTGAGGPGPGTFLDPNGVHVQVPDSDPVTKMTADKFNVIVDLIKKNYYEVVPNSTILDAMVAGTPSRIGSPYTYYMTREDMENQEVADHSNYSGIGATVHQNKLQQMEIIDLAPEGPAFKAGLKIGDVFVKVDGEELDKSMTVSKLASMIRGETGSQVTITIYRPSESKMIDFTITRGEVETEVIRTKMLSPGLGYMYIDSFTVDLVPKFEAGVKKLLDEGAKNVVFDMRGNPGGAVSSVTSMLDFLLPATDIAHIEGRSDGQPTTEEWTSDASMGVPEDMRYAILTNGGTASAAELFSGVLRDKGKAVIIGEKTYGKGSGTMTYTLTDGSGLNVTIFRYFLPSGVCIEGEGLQPDYKISLPPEAQLKPIKTLTPEEDTPLSIAETYFKDGMKLPPPQPESKIPGVPAEGPAATTVPGETTAPGKTTAPGETTAPGQTAAPGETTAPGETAAPSQAQPPAGSTTTIAPAPAPAPKESVSPSAASAPHPTVRPEAKAPATDLQGLSFMQAELRLLPYERTADGHYIYKGDAHV